MKIKIIGIILLVICLFACVVNQFYYYSGNQLQAVRYGDWKYHRRGEAELLYNLKEDIGETQNVIDQYPEIAQELIVHFQAIEEELGEGDKHSEHCRPSGYVELAAPLRK